jgi:hypothetical protein
MTDETVKQVIEQAAQRAVVQLSEEYIDAIIDTAVKRAISCYSTSFPCGISAADAKELSHFFGSLKDLGDDSLPKGIERFRANMKVVNRWQRVCERTGFIIWGSILVGVLSVVGTVGWIGFWGWLSKGGK